MTSLYDELGGEPAIDAAVNIFYRKVLADERLALFFGDVDMERQAGKQKLFLTMVTGGPAHYTGKDMRRAHAPLVVWGIDDSHFDAVVGHLADTLKELGVDDAKIARVGVIAESVRADVLGKDAAV